VVINVASLGGIRPSLGIGMYNTSKAALLHMTRQLAVELAPGVRVNALAPGLVKTHFARALGAARSGKADAVKVEVDALASLREKEILLKEIHHRVKNNLQITSSLLRLQTARIPSPEAKQLLRESQDRVRSMALVHEMLYRSHDLARIDFGEYARSLVQQLLRSYGVDVRQVKHTIDVDHGMLGVDEAVPCGLIINELVANSLKHAFPSNRQGRIWVRMDADEGRCTLRVGDDGVSASYSGILHAL